MYLHVSLVAIASLAAIAHADVTLNADSEFGASTVTVDQDNQLEFLDLGLTTGVSFEDMQNTHLQPGGAFEGWRHATRAEVDGLIASAGVVRSFSRLTPVSDAVDLARSLGLTFHFPDGDLARGFYDGGGFGHIIEFGPAFDFNKFETIAYYNVGSHHKDDYDETGHYLVRELPSQACPADFTGDGQLDFFDVAAFISAFNTGDDAADLDDNGSFDFFDVSSFLMYYSMGCP